MKKRIIIVIVAVVCCLQAALAGRTFVHPGISYTQADIDRMRSLIAAKQEPYYSAFTALKNSSYSNASASVTQRGTQIKEGQFNGTVGIDGRRAHDLALMYVLTGETKYADKAVQFINANSYYTNTSSRGTGPLDNGKINLLIEAAELLRDYPGWAAADQQRFKDMLTYPYFSTTEDLFVKYASTDESKNGITFYWNCYNFDSGRFGNQGMFAARALLAMGVYLDNDVIFDRAYQYLSGNQWQHFENYDDVDYKSGPGYGHQPFGNIDNTAYLFAWPTSTVVKESDPSYVRNYGYSEQLQYYIFKNGQCQESCRDQGHTLCGVMMYANIAEQCWNQGEDLWGALDNRILKGIEYSFRVNTTAINDYSSYMNDKDWDGVWTPKAWSVRAPSSHPNFANWDPRMADLSKNVEPESPDTFYQTWDRCGRVFYKDLTTADAGDRLGSSGCREMALAHYNVRMGLPLSEMPWLKRYRDYMIAKYKTENWGMDSGHYYEWCGWGTLSKHREDYMVGDPVSFQSGSRVMGIHQPFETIRCADYDYFAADGNGRTYQTANTSVSAYRPDGTVKVEEGDGNYVAVLANQEWLTYTINVPAAGDYTFTLRYLTDENSPMITLYIDNEECDDIFSEDTHGAYSESSWRAQTLKAGVHVAKILIQGEGSEVKLSTLTYKADIQAYDITVPEGVTCPTQAAEGQSVAATASESVVPGSIIIYDPTVDAKLSAVATAGGCTFIMPAHAVEVTALQHPSDGETIIATIATSTAGAGSAYARADHPDTWTVDVPAEPRYQKAVFVHPYKTHNYNRTNLKLVCPDGTQLDINATYDQPWDVSAHLLPGKTNTFAITNERTAGIDYWANGIATKASYLTRLELSAPESDVIDALQAARAPLASQAVYDLQGRRVFPTRSGLYITGRRKIYIRK
ncbi:MAG: alginate lyase family protein [Bacteroidaceae bacterium]|nr:alginate lyase family protein [Bacteroidaceae bacterium]